MKYGKTINLMTIVIKEVPEKVVPLVMDDSVLIPLSAEVSIHIKVDDLHDFVKYLTVVEDEVLAAS